MARPFPTPFHSAIFFASPIVKDVYNTVIIAIMPCKLLIKSHGYPSQWLFISSFPETLLCIS
jgi:hypothetical protein